MYSKLMNLLPRERRHALSREYVFRLGVVLVVLITALTLIGAVLLLPTYVLLVESARTKQTHLTSIKSSLSSIDESVLSARLATLTADAKTLLALAKTPSASGILRTLLAVSHPGVTLSYFSYTPTVSMSNKSGKGSTTIPATLVISGTAATRDALRNYQLALQSAPFISSATLPISTYAKDADIAFTITATLKL